MARKKLGDLLIERGHLTPQQLEDGLAQQTVSGQRLGDILLETGIISQEQLLSAMSERLAIPKLSLDMMVIDPGIISRVSVDLARRYTLIPVFAVGNTLTLAMADPLNIIAIDEIRYRSGCDVKRALASATDIKHAIDQYYSVADSLKGIIDSEDRSDDPQPVVTSTDEDAEAETPTIKLVNLIISKAIKDKASDIHIEPDEHCLRVRYRISGIMREEASPPKAMQNELISRVKVAASLDVSEKRLPQDGRFTTMADDTPIDLRVSTLPTIHGEKIVIRILDQRNLMRSFADLGLRHRTVEAWQDLIGKPEGLILLSGPTSSGKTSTLYSTLQEINSVEKNIITVEDPVEYSLPMINQVQISEKAGLTFPSTLRSILRQNPDIIMIGEIRDTETAQMAIRSALTGHLVFSTIHTNDAPSAITRLVDMGVEGFMVGAALQGVLAQRLVRKNCSKCSEEYVPSEASLARSGLSEMAGAMKFYRGSGCVQCRNTGFDGQTGIFELLKVTPDIADLIFAGASVNAIRDAGRSHGYLPLFETGLEKITGGQVSLEELLKETSNIEDYSFRPSATGAGVVHAHSV